MTFLGGLAFGAIGIYLLFMETKGFIKTTAVITRIESRRNGKHMHHDVYVEYDIDGKIYSGKCDTYSSSYREGREIPIYYDPNDPNRIHGESKKWGVFTLLIGICLLIAAVKNL